MHMFSAHVLCTCSLLKLDTRKFASYRDMERLAFANSLVGRGIRLRNTAVRHACASSPKHGGIGISDLVVTRSASAQRRRIGATTIAATAGDYSQSTPPAIGLVPQEGTTGTCTANLWPLPILGGYGWNLFVWRRSAMTDHAVSAHVHDLSSTKFSLSIVPREETARSADVAENIPGVVTGDYNVAAALQSMCASPLDGYRLDFMDQPANNFLNLKTQVTVARRASAPSVKSDSFWDAAGHWYAVDDTIDLPQDDSFQVFRVRFL
jgi:hypothetical protein